MKEIFTGTGVALVTPFKDNQIDFDSMKNLIEKCLKEKAQAFVVFYNFVG